jgi:hypothetical protein
MDDSSLLTRSSAEPAGTVSWPSDEARAWVTALLHRAAGDPAIVAIVLHGSAVRAAGRPSDVDILLVHRGAAVRADAPVEVDLRQYAAGEIDARIVTGDELLGSALRFGTAAFERDSFWSSLARRWLGRVPLPSSAAAEQRARQALRAAEQLRSAGDDDAASEMRLTGLTQQARARLARAGIFPLSRPELPDQLLRIGETDLAAELDLLIATRQ